MDAGRDLDRRAGGTPGPGGLPWRTRWFRAVVVFGVAAASAAVVVPQVLLRHSDPVRTAPGRPSRPLAPGEPTGRGGRAGIPGAAPWRTLDIARAVNSSLREAGPAIQEMSGAVFAAPRQTRPTAPGKKSLQAPESGSTASGAYWVQVGAYRDAETARLVARRLREYQYPVQESVITRGGTSGARDPGAAAPTGQGERDRYEIVATGATPAEVEAKLRAKGMTSRAAPEGSVVTPGLPLGEAVALSKDLADEGLSVRVRRIGTAAAARPAQGGGTTETFYRVRVGSFADRGAALAALKDLEIRGYKPFLARGE